MADLKTWNLETQNKLPPSGGCKVKTIRGELIFALG